jgi:hypothetical protein
LNAKLLEEEENKAVANIELKEKNYGSSSSTTLHLC